MPFCETVTFTDKAACGVGLALMVKVAAVPSVTVLPAVMLTSGVGGGGGGTSSSATVTVAVDCVCDMV